MNPILARLKDEPLLVNAGAEDWFSACADKVAEAMDKGFGDMEASSEFWPDPDSFEAYFRPYVVEDGVLQVPVQGMLLNKFPYALGSWATGYEYIGAAIERGMADENVKGIALMIDSPGGVVAGNFDLVDDIYAARGSKPIRAYGDTVASGAYSIASAADDITVSRDAAVGSIGVLTMHIDVSKAMDERGVKITFIHAGKHKVEGNPYEPLGKEARARIQDRIDSMYDVFVSTVARNRGMEEKDVRATEALVYTPVQAVEKGLADQIGRIPDSIAAFQASFLDDEGEDEMAEKTQADPKITDEALATARDEGFAAGKAEGMTEGAKAERARITAILDSDEGKARPKAALSAALKTPMGADDAIAFLADLPEEKAAAAPAAEPTAAAPKGMFEAAMQNEGVTALGTDGGNQPDEAEMRIDNVFALAGKTRR